MLTLQCKDGAGGLRQGLPPRASSTIPFAYHNAMLDPECANITARILELPRYLASTWTISQVRSHRILAQEQEIRPGMAVWLHYIYGTWQSCAACALVGVNMKPGLA